MTIREDEKDVFCTEWLREYFYHGIPVRHFQKKVHMVACNKCCRFNSFWPDSHTHIYTQKIWSSIWSKHRSAKIFKQSDLYCCILWIFNWFGIWGVWRLVQSLWFFVIFLEPFLNGIYRGWGYSHLWIGIFTGWVNIFWRNVFW